MALIPASVTFPLKSEEMGTSDVTNSEIETAVINRMDAGSFLLPFLFFENGNNWKPSRENTLFLYFNIF
tara:strand:+ start:148 stop:354 length:207 start_codon:yes stop_codon:yes gene_type:complete